MENKTVEDTIQVVLGIRPGAKKLTPTDYGETKLCMETYAKQELSAYKERLKLAIVNNGDFRPYTIIELIDTL